MGVDEFLNTRTSTWRFIHSPIVRTEMLLRISAGRSVTRAARGAYPKPDFTGTMWRLSVVKGVHHQPRYVKQKKDPSKANNDNQSSFSFRQ